MTYWTVTLEVRVTDEQALYDAARANYVLENGEDYPRHLGTREEPDTGNCLRQLADPGVSWPGTSIEDSSAE